MESYLKLFNNIETVFTEVHAQISKSENITFDELKANLYEGLKQIRLNLDFEYIAVISG